MKIGEQATILSGRVVMVTGAARGIGHAISRLAGECGAQVVSCDIAYEDNNSKDTPGSIFQLTGDVSQEEDCNLLVEKTLDRFGRIDVLINNAGILEVSRATIKQDLAHWKTVMDINLQGTFMMSQMVAKTMVDQSIHGSIVNISSVVGLSGFRASNAYGVSKAGVAMLTKTMSADLASHNIRVNAIAPGFINTAMTANLGGATKVERDKFMQRIPMDRFGEASEIAEAVIFLASKRASYITGAVLPVDGGWSAFGGPSEG